MIITAFSYFMQMLTVLYYNIEQNWIVYQDNDVTITIGSVIIWYLCIIVIFQILIRLLGGIATTWKDTMKDG